MLRMTMATLFLAFLAMQTQTVSADDLRFVGHRGASHDAPENTVVAFKLGFEQGADFVEADLRLTSDGHIILLHDNDTKRVGGTDKPAIKQTLAEIRKLDVGSFKGSKYAGEKVPTLAEGLAVVPAGKGIFLELKAGPEIVPPLVAALKQSPLKPEQQVIIGFNLQTVTLAKKALPHLKVYWLASFKQDKQTKQWKPDSREVLAKAKAAGLDGVDLQAGAVVDARLVQAARAAGLEVHVWTVNDAMLAKKMRQAGVVSITTDRPEWLREQLTVKSE